MRKNKNTCIRGDRVVLVPYQKHHVLKYHEWMKSEELQTLTASEPLTLDEEYDMQQSWLNDDLKCTFIVLDTLVYEDSHEDVKAMIGDVNLFFNDSDNPLSAEIEIMIAEKHSRGQGRGKITLMLMMRYGVEHLGINVFTAKIGYENKTSLTLFEKIGFQEVQRSEVFQEVTLSLNVDDKLRTFLCDQTSGSSTTEDWPNES